jgi:8-oxo-dGTP pyrophosphatase MutT (NUDIX family)
MKSPAMISQRIELLQKLFAEPLPGANSQLLMGSDMRMKELMLTPENEYTKKSGVLILLYPKNGELFSVLIQRPEYDGIHSGQMAFPGGKYELIDADLSQTALRETHEEIGVNSETITITGALTKLFIPPSNYSVFPFVGFTETTPVFKTDPQEVAGIVEYNINCLLDDSIVKVKDINIRNKFSIRAPYFDIGGKTVWGATAMILSEFKVLLKKTEQLSFC